MRLLPLIPAVLVPLGGCVTVRSIDDGIARARFGETIRVGKVALVPERLIEDSRCPAGVLCIRAGTVRIAVRIAGRPTELELNRPVAAGDRQVTLVEVYPDRRDGAVLYPDQYRFGFRGD